MRGLNGWVAALGMIALAAPAICLASPEGGAIIKTLDRKFPTGKYCPLESRAAAGVDLSFVAPAATVRITFSANNQDGSGQWNAFHVDNVTVVDKPIFDAHLASSIPGFDDCYNPSPPPGQATGGMLNAPAYNFNDAGTTEKFLDLFSGSTTGWTGSHLYYDAASTAPTNPANGTGTTTGSLGLGLQTDGAIAVSASRTITGLTPNQQYVVFAWWSALVTSPITIRIDIPCADQDGDGFVLCSGGCDLLPGQTCGDCNDTNPRCGASCTDHDGDGFCVPSDCDDNAATCTTNCATDADTDGVPDCRDGCMDTDHDGYGTAGGAGNTCLGADCSPANPWCNASCVDADGDGHCTPGDCADTNASVANGLAEVNDCSDQQCPGDPGYGVPDEVSGKSGFLVAGNKSAFGWPAQTGATNYLAVRSSSPTFPAGCVNFATSSTSVTDAANPASGSVFYYLVRATASCKGSWGQRSGGVERAAICGQEAACGNAIDDDADTATDCADPDCNGTPPCRVQTFGFVDTTGDDIADTALQQFFQSATAGANDFICVELFGNSRLVSWCAQNAGFYRTQYLSLASTAGSVTSGSWNKWRKAPSTGNNWQGPDTSGHLNTYGDDCFGSYSWCSEQFAPEPQDAIFPNRTNDCEVYDLATGACAASVGGTWQVVIRIAATRALACLF